MVLLELWTDDTTALRLYSTVCQLFLELLASMIHTVISDRMGEIPLGAVQNRDKQQTQALTYSVKVLDCAQGSSRD